MTPDYSLGAKIIERIAAKLGVDPLELDRPLYDSIDTDALETVIENARNPPKNACLIEFSYHDFIVTVDETQHISIREQESSIHPDE